MPPPESPEKPKWPLQQARTLGKNLLTRLSPACEHIEIAGSIRRQKPEVGDIELLAIPKFGKASDLFGEVDTSRVNQLWELVDGLARDGDTRLQYTKAGDRYRQFLVPAEGERLIKVDLFTCARDNWGWAFLVRTGSANFSHHIASRLNAAGYTSKDFWICGIAGTADRMETPAEEDVFALAHEKFRPPEERSW